MGLWWLVGLRCLPMPHKKEAKLIWVNNAWWVCAVCQCPTKRKPSLYGLIVLGGSVLFANAPQKGSQAYMG